MDATETVRKALRGLDEPGGKGFLALLADDAEMASPLATVRGRDQIGEFIRGMHASFSDWKHEVTVESAGDLVVAEGTWSGTHTGPMPTPQGEVPPTGRRPTIRFAGVVRVRDGRLVSVHNYFDRLEFMSQLGLMPEPAVA
jgi:ketosteroid isomerase-like protein